MPKPRVLNNEHYPSAAITFDDVTKAWFVYDGQAYPIVKATDATFKAAVLDLAPHWKDSPTYGEVLASVTLDAVTRWWLLCGLADAGKPMTLYGSREAAEQAQRQPSQLDQPATIAL